MNIPSATYRIQFTPDFGFKNAGKIVPYLAELGISHIYASPIFHARKGSTHGYDLINPLELNPELGTDEDFDDLIETAHKHNLLWIQDIVPNHMAYHSDNKLLYDLLEKGQMSEFFSFFDIDWDSPFENLREKLLAPVLGDTYADTLESGLLKLELRITGFCVNYYQWSFPIKLADYPELLVTAVEMFKPDTDDLHIRELIELIDKFSLYEQEKLNKEMLWVLYANNEPVRKLLDSLIDHYNGKADDPNSFEPLDTLLSNQLYQLSYWENANQEINFRRFFHLSEFISLDINKAKVFEMSHSFFFECVSTGKFDGLRVDHIDGIFDPNSYLEHLRSRCPDITIYVEKILDMDERLPDWPCQGTTGYDCLNYINSVFVPKENVGKFSRVYADFLELAQDYRQLLEDSKRLVIEKFFAGDITNLTAELKKTIVRNRYGKNLSAARLQAAIYELIVALQIYRTYISPEIFSDQDKAFISKAFKRARSLNPDLEREFGFLQNVFFMDFPSKLPPEQQTRLTRFIMKFQQVTSPVMAKGFEDTFLYNYNRLISLNEVGSSPDRFGISLDDFHEYNRYKAKNLPFALNALSTHDTKRGEDARARLNVLAEIPGQWQEKLVQWSRTNVSAKTVVDTVEAPDRNDEYMIYQAILGSWPLLNVNRASYKQRLIDFVVKAIREGKRNSNWLKPDTAYEQGCSDFIDTILAETGRNIFLKEFTPFQQRISFFGMLNSLSQVLLKFTVPGVPDTYQGCESCNFSMVDPDNRRAVDYEQLGGILSDLKRIESSDQILKLFDQDGWGGLKVFLTLRILQFRKRYQNIFDSGSYTELNSGGRFADNIISFARQNAGGSVIVIAPRFFTDISEPPELPLGGKWKDTNVKLPADFPDKWENIITGEILQVQDKVKMSRVLNEFPCALLKSQ